MAPRHASLCAAELSFPLPLAPFWMPAAHVVGVGFQVRSRPEVLIVELQVQMVGLQVGQHKHAGDGARELAESLVDVLCLKRHALLEFLAVDLRARAYPRALLPGTRRAGVKGPTGSELPLCEGLNSCPHVGVVRWTVALEIGRASCR